MRQDEGREGGRYARSRVQEVEVDGEMPFIQTDIGVQQALAWQWLMQRASIQLRAARTLAVSCLCKQHRPSPAVTAVLQSAATQRSASSHRDLHGHVRSCATAVLKAVLNGAFLARVRVPYESPCSLHRDVHFQAGMWILVTYTGLTRLGCRFDRWMRELEPTKG